MTQNFKNCVIMSYQDFRLERSTMDFDNSLSKKIKTIHFIYINVTLVSHKQQL